MAFANPLKNIERLGIGEEMKVADFGAGSGAYSLLAAKTAFSGQVYAIDVQRELLSRINSESRRMHLHNIKTIWTDAEELGSTRLENGMIDRAIASNVFFQVEHKEGLIKEIVRTLRNKGKLMLIDWTDSFGGIGPVPEKVFKKNSARALGERAGLTVISEFDAGDHHYGIIFEKK